MRSPSSRAPRVILAVATLASFHALMVLMVARGLSPDFPWHNNFVHAMRLSGRLTEPHFLYDALVLGIQLVLEKGRLVAFADYRAANYVVAMASLVATALCTFAILKGRITSWNDWQIAGVSFLLLFVDPLWILGPGDRQMYLGYIAPSSYHNPTTLLVKPLALLTFFHALRAFESSSGLRTIVAAFTATALSAIAKPSHLIALLPAAGLMAVVCLLRRKFVDIRMLALGLFAPAIIVLVAQFAFAYGSGQTKIVFAPLLAMRLVSQHLLWKFALSVVFPALVVALYARTAVRDPALQLGGGAFFVAAAYTYLLAESGREVHGNFGWSSQLALWIVFVFAAVHCGKQLGSRGRRVAAWGAFALHAASGVLYIAVMMYLKATYPAMPGLYH